MQQFIGSFYNESELNTLFEKSKGDSLELIFLLRLFMDFVEVKLH